MSSTAVRALALSALALVGACYSGDAPAFQHGIPNADGGVASVVLDLPCDVSGVLEQYCIECHNSSALSASKQPFDSYAALTASAGSGSVLQTALARVANTKDPMPPSGIPRPSASDVQILQSWVDAGYPRGSCSVAASDADAGSAGSSVYDMPTTCSSKSYWAGGDRESAKMHPGGTCIACHSSRGEGPSFDVAGTLFATAHEPTDCNGSSATDVTVIITAANGQEITLRPNSAGNFYLNRSGLQTPYKARIERAGMIRAMVATQTSGDCNSCHTQDGANKAPGRIMLP